MGSGYHSVIMVDSRQCTANTSFTIAVHPSPIVNITVQPLACGVPGVITANISGGTPPYDVFFNGSDFGARGPMMMLWDKLSPALYPVTGKFRNNYPNLDFYLLIIILFYNHANVLFNTVQDSFGCAVDYYVDVEDRGFAIVVTVRDAPCYRTNGIINIYGFGGIPPYSYTVNGTATQDHNTLPAGYYEVTATDSASCSITTNVLPPFIRFLSPISSFSIYHP